jgi:hypothetical protein
MTREVPDGSASLPPPTPQPAPSRRPTTPPSPPPPPPPPQPQPPATSSQPLEPHPPPPRRPTTPPSPPPPLPQAPATQPQPASWTVAPPKPPRSKAKSPRKVQKNRAKKAGTAAKNTAKRRDPGPSRGPSRALKHSKAATGSVPPASPPSSPELQRARKFSKSDEEHKRASFLGEGAGAWNVRPGSEFYSRPGTATDHLFDLGGHRLDVGKRSLSHGPATPLDCAHCLSVLSMQPPASSPCPFSLRAPVDKRVMIQHGCQSWFRYKIYDSA